MLLRLCSLCRVTRRGGSHVAGARVSGAVPREGDLIPSRWARQEAPVGSAHRDLRPRHDADADQVAPSSICPAVLRGWPYVVPRRHVDAGGTEGFHRGPVNGAHSLTVPRGERGGRLLAIRHSERTRRCACDVPEMRAVLPCSRRRHRAAHGYSRIGRPALAPHLLGPGWARMPPAQPAGRVVDRTSSATTPPTTRSDAPLGHPRPVGSGRVGPHSASPRGRRGAASRWPRPGRAGARSCCRGFTGAGRAALFATGAFPPRFPVELTPWGPRRGAGQRRAVTSCWSGDATHRRLAAAIVIAPQTDGN